MWWWPKARVGCIQIRVKGKHKSTHKAFNYVDADYEHPKFDAFFRNMKETGFKSDQTFWLAFQNVVFLTVMTFNIWCWKAKMPICGWVDIYCSGGFAVCFLSLQINLDFSPLCVSVSVSLLKINLDFSPLPVSVLKMINLYFSPLCVSALHINLTHAKSIQCISKLMHHSSVTQSWNDQRKTSSSG